MRLVLVLLVLAACGSRPRDLVDYDSFEVETPWCALGYFRDEDGVEQPARVCVASKKTCDHGRNKIRDSKLAQALLSITAVGVCEEM